MTKFPLAVWAAALTCLLAAGCNQGRSTPTNNGKRLIVLGVDGMDPGFLERHWHELPNLKRLRDEGDFHRLETTVPPQSPVAWSTFITGMDPGGHGIFDFIHRDPRTMTPVSSMAQTATSGRTLSLGPYLLPLTAGKIETTRHGKAFWQILSEHGVNANVIRMPTNFPPAECEGESLAGMGTPDLRGTFGTFTYFTNDASEKRRDVPGGVIVPVQVEQSRVVLSIEGPKNPLRADQARTFFQLKVDIDPRESAARLRAGSQEFILRQGEWSGWIKAEFPLLPGAAARGMFRVFARQLHPQFQLYVSPLNIDPESPELPISQPESYARKLAGETGLYYTQGMAEDTAALRQGVLSRPEYMAQTRLVADEHFKLFRHGVRNMKNGFLFFHFFGVDQNSHMLWGKFEKELLETYQRVDQEVGWVRAQAPGATLLIMSDHGFSTFERTVHLNSFLWKEGLLALTDPSKAGNEELFAHVDWSKTYAYSLGLNGVYLNLAGRERDGIVQQGADSDAVMKKLMARLKDFRDPDTGEAVVDIIYEPSKVFSGKRLKSAPDLLIGYKPRYRSSWQTALGAVPSKTVEPNTEAWIGDHCIASHFVPGVFLSSRKTTRSDPKLLDVTATILKEFGAPQPPEMSGRPMF